MSSIIVTNIAPTITEQQISEFFSFCGKISTISLDHNTAAADKSLVAKITFAKKEAAETALLLHDTKLGPTSVVVEADPTAPAPAATADDAADGELRQEDKPRSAIMAEILSYGYALSDKATQKSVEFDQKNGVSTKFHSFLKDVDDKLKVRERASATDEKYNVTGHLHDTKSTLSRYFEKALDNSTGSKIRAFYADSSKHANDVHKEARRLADMRTGKSPADTPEPELASSAPVSV
ncbi:uncharacterized protein V1510DRAFT_184015 [Dipodascopsis tothii]|uniref:uncharacterized protein n=1 Tax=Dipodascopsis tothii TaxID=44089 RepID=UPI0034CE6472